MHKYVHTEEVHPLNDPRVIVPLLLHLVEAESVVDFGCGTGTFLRIFQESGVRTVLGIDGSWVDQSLLEKNISQFDFRVMDLEKPVVLDRKYDLVVCLEVVEHLSPNSAETIVDSLTAAGDMVLFSAAVPQQGGQNHLNEQWLSYWHEKFLDRRFLAYDIIRPLIWHREDVSWWYRQNVVLMVKKDVIITGHGPTEDLPDLIHPDLFRLKTDRLAKIDAGHAGRKNYLKWLAKSVYR